MLLFFPGSRYPFGEIAFPVAVKLRPVFIDTEIFYDIVVAQLKIEVYKGYDAYFKQHQREEENGKKTRSHNDVFLYPERMTGKYRNISLMVHRIYKRSILIDEV